MAMAAALLKKRGGVGKGLFKQQKNDPEFLANQGKLKTSLIKSLSRAIKELQLIYANKEEEGGGTIEDCRPTQQLCASFEAILRHGLKAGWFGQSTSFWPVVLKISRKQAVEYIGSLQHAQTDNGRCRAWIRLAVNECSLESYINVLCQDNSLLSNYYETYSFLRDAEMVTALAQLLAGLSQLNINMTVDTASLEFEPVPEAHNRTMPTLKLKPVEEKQPTKVSGKHKSRKRSKQLTAREVGAVEVEDDSQSESEEGSSSVTQSWSEKGSTDALDIETLEPIDSKSHDESRNAPSSHDQSQDGSHDHLQSVLDEVRYDNEQGDTGTTRETSKSLLEWQFDNDTTLSADRESAASSPELLQFADEEKEENIETPTTELPESLPSSLLQENIHQEQYVSFPLKIDDDALLQHEGDDVERTPLQITATNPFESQFEDQLKVAIEKEEDTSSHKENLLLSGSTLTSSVSHNPFLEEEEDDDDEDEEDDDLKNKESLTNLFDEVDDPVPNHNLPLAVATDLNPFSSPPPLSPTNPFCEDLQRERNEYESTDVNRHNKAASILDQDTSNPFQDVWTPESVSPTSYMYSNEPRGASLNSSPNVSQKPSNQSSLETSPSVSPTLRQPTAHSGPPSDDLSSCASSLDLSMVLESSNFGELNYLQPVEDHYEAEMNVSQLEAAISRIKAELKRNGSESDNRRNLRKKVIVLQLRLQKMKELEEEIQSGLDPVSCEEVLGHRFVIQPWQSRILTNVTCEGCSRKIRGLVRRWYRCQSCQCSCHKACLSAINHMCTASKTRDVQEEVKYTLEVCPEKGLTKQQFRCASCNQAFNSTSIRARLCDYSGCYYCPSCHHNDVAVIPARVVHNWDFNMRKVCCRCSDLLSRLHTKPLVRVQQVNPLLYTYVQDLVTVEVLRQEVLIMKQFFLKCQAAKEARLLIYLDPFPHFKESAKLFSLSDFEAVYNGKLIPQLQEIHRHFSTHIKDDCQVCYKRGAVCKLCGSDEILFPFDRHVRLCPHCKKVFHKTCYTEMTTCPKCSRTKYIT